MLIKDMKPGDSGYILNWAIAINDGSLLINLNYDVIPESGSNHTVYLKRTHDGYLAANWIQEPEIASDAILSIFTKPYVWTDATDDTVAPVSLSSITLMI